jgi:hypothetical protein
MCWHRWRARIIRRRPASVPSGQSEGRGRAPQPPGETQNVRETGPPSLGQMLQRRGAFVAGILGRLGPHQTTLKPLAVEGGMEGPGVKAKNAIDGDLGKGGDGRVQTVMVGEEALGSTAEPSKHLEGAITSIAQRIRIPVSVEALMGREVPNWNGMLISRVSALQVSPRSTRRASRASWRARIWEEVVPGGMTRDSEGSVKGRPNVCASPARSGHASRPAE